jgi:hypothetical protein
MWIKKVHQSVGGERINFIRDSGKHSSLADSVASRSPKKEKKKCFLFYIE